MSVIGSAVGGLISGGLGLLGAESTNEAAASQASQSEQFSDHESSTQFQRGVADMRAAGLNPILAAGSPDSAPSGVAAPVINAIGDASQAGISNFSALQSARQTDSAIDNIDAQTKLNQVLAVKAGADATNALASARLSDAASTAKRISPLAADVVGTDLLSSARDTVASKMKDIVSHIDVSSASKNAASTNSIFPPNKIRDVLPDGTSLSDGVDPGISLSGPPPN